jgi:hypothetical protein
MTTLFITTDPTCGLVTYRYGRVTAFVWEPNNQEIDTVWTVQHPAIESPGCTNDRINGILADVDLERWTGVQP